MTVTRRLVGFALVLVLLFAGGFAVGRAVGPVGADGSPDAVESPTTGGGHTGGHP
jgi:hypothetical protein